MKPPVPGGTVRTWATRLLRVGTASGIFAGLFVFTLVTSSVTNDDYLHLATAQQVLLGEVPLRDFIDPGELLFYYSSAAVQVVFGRNLLSEVVLDVFFVSLGQMLVFVLAYRATRSYILGALATTFAALLAPRLYSYPKIAIYPVALLLIWHYADHRRTRTLLWISVCTVVAFLFRHDHGALIGASMMIMLLLVHRESGWRAVSRKVLGFGVTVAVLLLPFFWFLHVNTGVVRYWRDTLETGRAEYRRTVAPFPTLRLERAGLALVPKLTPSRIKIRWAEGVQESVREASAQRFRLSAPQDRGERTWEYVLNDPSSANIATIVQDPRIEDTQGIDRERFSVTVRIQEPNATAWLYYLTILLPPVALLVIGMDIARRPRNGNADVEKMVTAAVMAELTHLFLLRSASDAAIADVSPVTAVLSAWLLARAIGPGRIRSVASGLRPALGAGPVAWWRGIVWPVVSIAGTLAIVTTTVVAFARTSGGFRLADAIAGETQPLGLTLTGLQQSAPPFGDEVPRYVFACTDQRDRLFVAMEYQPLLYYQSGRGFAAGRVYFLTSLAPSPEALAFSLDRLLTERVPIVLTTEKEYQAFSRAYPAMYAHVSKHYRQAGHIGPLDVFVDSRIQPVRTYGPNSLPCFRSAGDPADR